MEGNARAGLGVHYFESNARYFCITVVTVIAMHVNFDLLEKYLGLLCLTVNSLKKSPLLLLYFIT